MANVLVNDTHLKNIANAIREKKSEETQYKPNEMASAISNMSIIKNGVTYDAFSIQPGYETCPTQATVYGDIIRDYEFYQNGKLVQVNLPEDLKEIGVSAFQGCHLYNAGKTIRLPETVTTIKDYAFYGLINLTFYKLPDSLSTLGMYALNGCEVLSSELPPKLQDLSQNMFYGCSFPNLVALPNTLTRIPEYAFYGGNLSSLTSLPDGITTIDSYAFYGNNLSGLASLPASLQTISQLAFSNCNSLYITEIPANVKTIGDRAFYHCYGLKNITFKAYKKRRMSISENAFEECSYLTDIYVPWSEGDVANAPWGATNATVHYDYKHRLEAEIYGIANRYDTVSDTSVMDMVPNSNNAQSYESLINDGYIEKSQLPYVSYMVKAPKSGTYNLTVGYTLLTNTGYTTDNYYMVVSVNDSEYHKCYFESQGGDSSSNYDSGYAKASVELQAGVNVIRCISAVSETYPMISFLDHDYIEFDTGVSSIEPQKTYLQSGESSNIYNYTARAGSANSDEPKLEDYYIVGNCSPWEAQAAGITYDNLTLDSLSKVPHFSYTVEVPADGYYDMDIHYNTGTEGAKGYFAMLVDGVKTKIYFENPNNDIVQNSANASTYLTKGTHTISITSCFAWGDTDPSYYGLCDFGSLVVYGGITKSSEQLCPFAITNDSQDNETV